uniref:Uncharacterized protein n=1 Tax=Lactuca sativa TaxID=4236 RepID=A0A9R1XAK3_LACSA|nr:hypothetical protein LSAT_V11C500272950 [Lactuca sativa]
MANLSIVKINGASCVNRKNTVVALASYENGGKNSAQNAPEKLEPLWDDGYGTQTMKCYTKIAMYLSRLISSDGGPPRWFCLKCPYYKITQITILPLRDMLLFTY